jgi:2-alkyl-3-oxoalkanoate reductase
MKIFVAGASGAVGTVLVPLLIADGHSVTASAHNPEKLDALRALGAEAVALNGLNRNQVIQTVDAARPDVVIHEMTALSAMTSVKNFDKEFELTNRLRTEGTDNLLAGARAAGASRFIAQSYTGWPNERTGGPVKTEDDPLDSNPPESMAKTLTAIRALEAMVLSARGVVGIVLRYGSFYGPGTSISADGNIVEQVRRRRFPIVGEGTGVWSFLHITDAAEATRIAVDGAPAGIYNIVDDEPAEVRVWLPELAKAVGAKPPIHVPAWLARPAIGETGIMLMNEIRGSSNAKAKRELDWQPRFASWRQGFRNGLSPDTAASGSSSAPGTQAAARAAGSGKA